jgi:hypothetical protein
MSSLAVSSAADQAKSATAEPDTDSEAEEEREFLSAKAKLLSIETERLSAKAKVAYLETSKANRKALKMDAELTASLSDIEAREDALMAKLVDPQTVSHWEKMELWTIREGYINWLLALSKKTRERRKIKERSTRLEKFMDLIQKVSSRCYIFGNLEIRLADSRGRLRNSLRILMGNARRTSWRRIMGMTEKVTKNPLLRMIRMMAKPTKHQLPRMTRAMTMMMIRA